MKKGIGILFIGDVFGKPGINNLEKNIPLLKEKYKIDFIIAQGENVSGRKGLNENDYLQLKKIGINAITLGNHVWADENIYKIIDNPEIIRPYNINKNYKGHGTSVFTVNGYKLRITSMLGITFNKLLFPWNEETADNFFDAFDQIYKKDQVEKNVDFHIIDFHAETTSEKSVFGLYVDGKVDAFIGTHTHIQTNDAKILPNGTLYITDAGMTGPMNAAIGANFDEVYQRMRYEKKIKFTVSKNKTQFNGVYLKLSKDQKRKKIIPISLDF
nr:TIGR00282 family metallophosphoesterase [Mesomycoplasma lagogenitalium]